MEGKLRAGLREEGVDASDPAAAARLAALRPGFRASIHGALQEAEGFVVMGRKRLVWTEQWLDNGPPRMSVVLDPWFRLRTRADLIGVLLDEEPLVVVREYKTSRLPADPGFDTGLLARAIWALNEIRERPRTGSSSSIRCGVCGPRCWCRS
jgi:hypothetical protein